MTRPKKKDLKQTVEAELTKMLAGEGEPSDGRMKLLKTAIGFLAVQAKLEENEYGGFFDPDTPSLPKQQKGKKPDAGGDEGRQLDPDGEDSFFPEGPASGLPS